MGRQPVEPVHPVDPVDAVNSADPVNSVDAVDGASSRQEWNAVAAVYAGRPAARVRGTDSPAAVPAVPAAAGQAGQGHPITALLPQDLRGQRVLDAGCGAGSYAVALARRGATVVGVDVSDALVAMAVERERAAPLGITYLVHDLMAPLPAALGTFDAAVSIMTVMDVTDPLAAVRHIGRAVRPGGVFAFSLVHPCFFRPRIVSGQWGAGIDVGHYFDRSRVESRRITAKDGSGATASYRQYHRTLGDYLNALAEEGFCLERFHEPGDTTLAIAARRQPV